MPTIVQKYGGTSVGSVERIQAVADRVVRAREEGNDVVVVVSAMGDTTDDLLAMAKQIAPIPEPRELDMLLTAGERIAMSLLSIAINARGCKAVVHGIAGRDLATDTQHGSAKIVEIRPKRIIEALEAGNVVIVAGFQGLSTNYDITTLGRGGSDTTAVAMAAALGAEVCEIYTDVTGVFSADPRIHPRARKIEAISYEEMLELAAAGARVLSSRSVGVRSKARREAPRAVVVRRRAGHVGAGGGRAAHGRRPDLGCGPRQRRGEGDARSCARPTGRGRHGVPGHRRRGHQRRHDRAERVARRRHGSSGSQRRAPTSRGCKG